MAHGKRGKIKENFEGIHRNFIWIEEYNKRNLELIGDVKPQLTKGIKAFQKACTVLDEMALDLYAHI